MTRWAPQKSDTLAALSTEILHNYGRGQAIVGVDGTDDSGSTRFADELAEAVRQQGRTVVRATLTVSDDVEAFRSDVVGPFREGEDAVLLVDGTELQRPAIRGLFHFVVWLDGLSSEGAQPDRTRANAIVDNSDADHPRRVFADSC